MDVDSPPASVQSQLSHRQSVLPEVEMFSYLLVIIFLIDQKQLEEVSCLPTFVDSFPLHAQVVESHTYTKENDASSCILGQVPRFTY